MSRHLRTVILAVLMLSTFMIVGLVQTPEALAQPTVTGSDCSGCHDNVLTFPNPAQRSSPDPTIDWGVIIGVTPTAGSPASITVNENSTFDLDFIIREMTQVNAAKDVSMRMMIGLPAATWSVGATSTVRDTFGGAPTWDANWEAMPWDVGTTSADFSTWFPNSPIAREADAATSSWTANGRAFYDNATANDLDGTAEEMGADVLITVPAGIGSASPGTPYKLRILGVGHFRNAADKAAKGHVSVEITVNVVSGGGGDTTNPVVGTVTPANQDTGTLVDATFDISAAMTEAAGN